MVITINDITNISVFYVHVACQNHRQINIPTENNFFGSWSGNLLTP